MVPDDTLAVGRRPLLRRLGTGALVATGVAAGGAPVGASGATQPSGAVGRTISVNSPSGVLVEYEFTLGLTVRPTTDVPATLPHDEATIDPDDGVEGTAVRGATAGGVDSYEYAIEVESFEATNCEDAGVWIDGEPVDPCDLDEAGAAAGVLSVNSPAGALVEYEFDVAGEVAKSSYAPPSLPHGQATRDPDDVVDGLTVTGATAGGVDSYEYAVAPTGFAATNCEEANVWLRGQPADACALSGGDVPGGGGGGGEEDAGGDDADGGQDGGDQDGSTAAAKLLAPDGAADDQFGTAVAVDGDAALVGAPFAANGAGTAGAAYAFARGDAGWAETGRVGPDGSAGECTFGAACALDGGSGLVGAPGAPGADRDPGLTYLLDRNGSGWTRVTSTTDTDEPLAPAFGASLALEDTTAVVGWYDPNFGDGLGYAFDVDGGGWSLSGLLEPPSVDLRGNFGEAVALDGGTALVGASHVDDPGAVHVFGADGSGWSHAGAFGPDGGASGDDFGRAVALEGSRAVVGAPGADESGAAYVFEGSGGSWSRTHELAPEDAGTGANIGRAVAVDGDAVLVGAPGAADGSGTGTGAAYVYDVGGSSASRSATLLPGDGGDGDRFGRAVALSGSTAVVGAPLHGVDGAGAAGAAYVFGV